MKPYYEDDLVKLYHGDCIDVLRELPDASVDSIVTDPPYGLGFMGREWDNLPPGLPWAQECLRVLKPGGHLLAFGGTRTWHRLACAVEDAGFEIRDSIAWMYGSGFPKSLDVSKAIDKAAGAEREVVGPHPYQALASSNRQASQGATHGGTQGGYNFADVRNITAPATPDAERWQGWGSAMKPAFEPVVVARKPLSGTVASNVLAHGTGALNIDGCRVGDGHDRASGGIGAVVSDIGPTGITHKESRPEGGRWPANVVLDESQAAALDQMSGETVSPSQPVKQGGRRMDGGRYGSGSDRSHLPMREGEGVGYGDTGGASRFFYVAKADASERVRVPRKVLRLRSDLTPEQVDHVTARLREAGVQVD